METLAGDEQLVSIFQLKPAIFTNIHDKNKNPKQSPTNKNTTGNTPFPIPKT